MNELGFFFVLCKQNEVQQKNEIVRLISNYFLNESTGSAQ